jgi:hypothetical protein
MEYCIHRSLVKIHAPDWLRDLEGKTEPIALENVTTSELDAVLCIMYPTYVCLSSPTNIRLIFSRSDVCRRDLSSAADWMSVLRLATRWNFASFRTLALQNLEPISSPLQKLLLARELDISHWLLPALVAMCLREEPLSLGEMRLLPLEDAHLIFTIHERVQTARVAATVEDVSAHIQPLIAMSVLAFTLTPDSNIMKAASDEQPLTSAFSLSPAVAHVPIVSTIKVANAAVHVPTDATFDPEAMRKALEEAAYDRAVTSISSAHSEEASHVIVEWATDCCAAWPSDAYPLLDLVFAFAYRCARQSSFSGTAADVLAMFKNNAEGPRGEQSRTSDGGTRLRLGDCLQHEFREVAQLILRASRYQSQHQPCKGMGKVMYGQTERWLAESDFTLRLHNCTAFMGEALRADIVSEHFITDGIRNLACGYNADALYSSLLALGHHLDTYPAGSSLDTLLKEFDALCNDSNNSRFTESLESHRISMTVSASLSPVKIIRRYAKKCLRKY